MIFISVTRLRIRSLRYLPQFILLSLKSATQAQRAEGFRGGKLLVELSRASWTLTAWESEAAMRAYRNADSHRVAMPKLLEWCDEASVGHWNQETATLPDWHEAHRRMVAEGRLSKVNHPSLSQNENHIAKPKSTRLERTLKPILTQK